MSEIAKKIDAKTAALVANATDPEQRGGSTLMAPLHLELDLEETRTWCAGTTYFDGVELPRFGVLSLMLQTTPCYVYGHPEMKKKFGKTAWTDGIHIFICDDFYEKLLADSRATNGTEYGIELLLLHEQMHVLFNHVGRLKKFPPRIRNRATDLSINTKLQVGFPDMPWCKTLRETGVGFQPGEKDKYPKMAEETIAREIVNEEFRREQDQKQKDEQDEKKNKKNQKNQGDPQPGQGQGQPQSGSGQSQPGKGGKGQGQPSGGERGEQDQNDSGDGDEQDQDNNGQQPDGQDQDGGQEPGGQKGGQGQEQEQEPGDQFGAEDDNHLHDLKDVINSLKEMGLEKVVEALKYPDPDDPEAIERHEEEARLRQMEAVQKAAAQMARNGGKYPGAHIVESAVEMVKGFTKGKMSFRLAAREAIYGDGQRYKYTDEEAGEPYFIEEIAQAAGTEVWIGQDLPYKPDEAVMVLIDTSGSVSEEDIRAFLSEIFELKTAANGFGDQAAEIVVVCADTVLRGDPTEITDSNVGELLNRGVKIFGRGGTDVENSMKEAMKLPQFRDKKIRSMIVMSDLYTTPPQPERFNMPEGCAVVYVTAPSTSNAHEAEFAKAVEHYARVVSIREGTEVDLSEDAVMDMPSPGKRVKPKGRGR